MIRRVFVKISLNKYNIRLAGHCYSLSYISLFNGRNLTAITGYNCTQRNLIHAARLFPFKNTDIECEDRAITDSARIGPQAQT